MPFRSRRPRPCISSLMRVLHFQDVKEAAQLRFCNDIYVSSFSLFQMEIEDIKERLRKVSNHKHHNSKADTLKD